MFQNIKNILSFLWAEAPDPDNSLKDADELLSILHYHEDRNEALADAAEEKQTREHADYSCCTLTGIVTGAAGDVYTIDNKYEFTSSLQHFEVGLEVSFTFYTVEGDVRVSEVSVLDRWLNVCRQTTWCHRNLICKVVRRQNRKVFLEPAHTSVQLDRVSAQLDPIVGDWVVLEAKVEIDENVLDLAGKILEVEKIRPLRPHNLYGWVRKWCNKTRLGVINQEVFFNGDALDPGYLPIIGDRVLAMVAESEQQWYKLRALKVLPVKQQRPKLFLDDSHVDIDFVLEKDGVSVSDNIFIKSKKLDGTYRFQFEIMNSLSTSTILSRVNLPSLNSQCEIVSPGCLTDIEIRSGGSVVLKGVCKVRHMGTKRELIVFQFADCKVGRWITVRLESSKMHHKAAGRTGYKHHPRFVSRRLPEYSVPQKLLDLVLKYEETGTCEQFIKELGATNPCLLLPLTYSTYEDRFHTLLHLEEIYELLAIRAYAEDETYFVKNNELLMMVADDLAEKRPSLIIGDKILAKDSRDVMYAGVICEVMAKHVLIKFDTTSYDSYNDTQVSVVAVASRKGFRRMHQAVGLALRNLESVLFPAKLVEKEPQIDFLYEPCVLSQETNISIPEPEQTETQNHPMSNEPAVNTYSKSTTERSKLEWNNNNLNYFQKEAVWNILLGVARPLPYIILGPPGTGKTVTLVEAIVQLLRLVPHSRMLVATSSNSSANVIALHLIDSGLLKPGDLIQLVDLPCVVENRLPAKLVPYCGTADVDCEENFDEMFTMGKRELALGRSSPLIGRHRITIGTCSYLGALFRMSFLPGHFTHIIVDEAGGAVEPEVMIPLSYLDLNGGQLILAGDPKQLGPVINSKGASAHGFEETFLDRLLSGSLYTRNPQGFAKTGGYDPRLVTRLIHNYRSLPQLLSLANKLFYDGQLISMISASESAEASLLSRLKEILPGDNISGMPAVAFHGVIGDNYQSADCPSWCNRGEAAQIFFYVLQLYRLGLNASDIGIITPYLKQVRHIRALLEEAEFDIPKVGRVEEFQGQEFKVILISTVRVDESFTSHDLKHKLGFLSNPRRVNVALTRAQVLVIVVGNPHLLCKDQHWQSVINYCIESGAYRGCDLPSPD